MSDDLAYLSCLPNIVIMCPSDEAELKHMIATAAAYNSGPCAVRYPRGAGVGCHIPETSQQLAIGKGRIVRSGSDLAILSLGTRLAASMEAAEHLSNNGVNATVADARFAKPLDTNLVNNLIKTHNALLIVEEGSPGGFSAHVMTYLANQGRLDGGLMVRILTLPDAFIEHDTQQGQLASAQQGLGQFLPSAQRADIQTLGAVGGIQQSQAQAALDAQRQTQLQRQFEPFQRIEFLKGIMTNLPTTQSTLTATTAPGANPVGQAIGAGLGAYSAYNLMLQL